MKDTKEHLGDLFLAILKSLYFLLTCGFVALKTYYWFLLPVFPDAPLIEYGQIIGLMMFLYTIKPSVARPLKEEFYKDNDNDFLVTRIIAPWVILGLCWTIKIFI